MTVTKKQLEINPQSLVNDVAIGYNGEWDFSTKCVCVKICLYLVIHRSFICIFNFQIKMCVNGGLLKVQFVKTMH